nr:nucleotidyl transferase AbiEii/AbiGii toxin family protein [Mesorhizobium amorphae]
MPLVAAETCFALKGGTAINPFIRDLPRLSVNIELVYLPMYERDEAFKKIAEALSRISDAISKAMPRSSDHMKISATPCVCSATIRSGPRWLIWGDWTLAHPSRLSCMARRSAQLPTRLHDSGLSIVTGAY